MGLSGSIMSIDHLISCIFAAHMDMAGMARETWRDYAWIHSPYETKIHVREVHESTLPMLTQHSWLIIFKLIRLKHAAKKHLFKLFASTVSEMFRNTQKLCNFRVVFACLDELNLCHLSVFWGETGPSHYKPRNPVRNHKQDGSQSCLCWCHLARCDCKFNTFTPKPFKLVTGWRAKGQPYTSMR